VYAVGETLDCQSRENGRKALGRSGNPVKGTSFGRSPTVRLQNVDTDFTAAPQVARLITAYLSYDTDRRDWKDKTGIERVEAIRDYIQSDRSSWVREKTEGSRLIWNGATKEDHDSAVEASFQTPSSPPPQDQKEWRTFVVGLEQVGSPRCTNVLVPLPNAISLESCSSEHYYNYRLISYMLDKADEVPSLCTSLSQNHDFSQTNVGGVSDKKLFENPSWSGGS
jgi:hypothetical protein